MKKEKSCGAIIIDKENRILLIKHNQGHWAFPKGHTEAKETERETALREVYEETGLNIEIDTDTKEITTYSPEKGVIKDVIYFLGFPKEDKVKLQESEVCDFLWAPYQTCLKQITFPNDKEVLKKIYAKYQQKEK